jgi:ferredoxin
MNVKIIYFSQTQNTWLIAQAIAEGIRDKNAEVNLVNWMDIRTDPIEKAIGDCDLLGIGYPCFFYKAPFCIEEWVERFPQVDDRPYFQFAAYAGVPGTMFRRTDDLIRRKGWVILDWQAFLSWSSFQLYQSLPTMAAQFPDALELAKARQFGQFQVVKHTAYRAGLRNFLKRPEKGEWFWRKKAFMTTKKRMNKILPPFKIDAEECTQCGECINNCPDGAITYNTSGVPEFRGNCTRCYYCAKICPTGAIQNDWTEVRKMAVRTNWNYYPDWLKYWPELQHLWERHPNMKSYLPQEDK